AIGRASDLLQTSPSNLTNGLTNAESILNAIHSLRKTLNKLPSTPNSVETDQAIRSAQAQLLTERIADQRSQLAVASQQIEKLRSATNVDEVIGMAPLRISTLGYERVLLSWVEDEKWVPTSAYTLSGPDE